MSVKQEDFKVIEWSTQLEDILAQEGERCRGLAWLHIRAESATSKYNTYVQVPVIVLSTLAGTASVGSATLFGGGPASSIAIGLVSIGVGILNTLGGFFAFAKRTEAHRIAHLNYSKLSSKISIELSLPRDERMSPEPFLVNIRETMERMAETTPMCPEEIIAEFNKKFKGHSDEDIALPVETNGLHKIKIYRGSTRVDTPLDTPMEDGQSGITIRMS
jgi:hypothetical protein